MCMGDCSEHEAGGDARNGEGAEAPRLSDSEAGMERLVRTIEGEIVPRLVLTRRAKRMADAAQVAQSRDAHGADVKELVRLLLAHDVADASTYVETLRHRGATLEMICLQLLAPAARELGLLWEQDECDFMQVTIGLCRLHHLLRELNPEFHSEYTGALGDRRILLAPIPGEQHTFGLTLVAQFLRRAGWDVWHEFAASTDEILDIMRHNWFSAVGLSVGSDARLEYVSDIICSIRLASRNRAVGILIGGPVLAANPELATLVGADATAIDGEQAVMRADQFCRQLSATN